MPRSQVGTTGPELFDAQSYGVDEALFDAITAGASGFVLKQVLGLDLLNAIRTVGEGGSLLDPKTTTAFMNRICRERADKDPLNTFSEQERAACSTSSARD